MKLHIENIGKIKIADIDVDGITIITGSNNTGKSTMCKALFATLRSFYNLNKLSKNSIYKKPNIVVKDIFNEVFGEEISKHYQKHTNNKETIKSKVTIQTDLGVNEIVIGNNIKDIKETFKIDLQPIYIKSSDIINNLQNISDIILRLQYILGNDSVERDRILILDNPENNLHPEWQVAYARYIVLLQKKLNLHIVITTHSPFFLKAIEKASEEYDISEKCHYYYAHNDEGDAVIECVNENMEEIYSKMMMPLLSMMNDIWS